MVSADLHSWIRGAMVAHLVYTEGVDGSSPSEFTEPRRKGDDFPSTKNEAAAVG